MYEDKGSCSDVLTGQAVNWIEAWREIWGLKTDVESIN